MGEITLILYKNFLVIDTLLNIYQKKSKKLYKKKIILFIVTNIPGMAGTIKFFKLVRKISIFLGDGEILMKIFSISRSFSLSAIINFPIISIKQSLLVVKKFTIVIILFFRIFLRDSEHNIIFSSKGNSITKKSIFISEKNA